MQGPVAHMDSQYEEDISFTNMAALRWTFCTTLSHTGDKLLCKAIELRSLCRYPGSKFLGLHSCQDIEHWRSIVQGQQEFYRSRKAVFLCRAQKQSWKD